MNNKLLIPQNDQNRNDVFDFLADGMHERKEQVNADGILESINVFNPKIAWYQSHIINQPFGRMALYMESLENLALMCHDNMYAARAEPMKRDLLLWLDANKRSVDAKSSETWRDKNTVQSAMIHLLSRNKTEKTLTLHGDKKKGIAQAFGFGKEEEED